MATINRDALLQFFRGDAAKSEEDAQYCTDVLLSAQAEGRLPNLLELVEATRAEYKKQEAV